MKTQVQEGDFRCAIAQLLIVFCSVLCTSEIAQADCKGGVGTEDIVISDKPTDFYSPDDIVDCVTTGSITLGPNVTLPYGAVFNLIAPRVSIETEVEVLLGSQLRIFTGRRPLNDTGIVDCSDDTNNLTCPVATHPGQDAEYGRDVTHDDDSDGHAGFSFSKICNSGELEGEGSCPIVPVLGTGVNDWGCTKDNVTGLVWEVKTDDGGLQDKDNTYTWYNTDESINGGDAGTQNGGICTGSDCDTQSYAQAVNSQGLCGANDGWRMPNIKELESIARIDQDALGIDRDYFPNTNGLGYFSRVFRILCQLKHANALRLLATGIHCRTCAMGAEPTTAPAAAV